LLNRVPLLPIEKQTNQKNPEEVKKSTTSSPIAIPRLVETNQWINPRFLVLPEAAAAFLPHHLLGRRRRCQETICILLRLPPSNNAHRNLKCNRDKDSRFVCTAWARPAKMGPFLSVRPDAARTMAGAIFMSNTFTREQCFQTGVFGLPIEYESFIYDVRKGMPLFLFDHNLRKLYGVFEAASDGGLNINRDAFQRAFPAQVRVNIIWKCRPLIEDEFAPAIEENYYQPRKFYFDLSYEQVVRLYELFNEKRVERPIIHDYPVNESLGTKDVSKGALDKRSLTPNVSYSDHQSHLLVPDISTIVRRYSSNTSKHIVVPPSVEVEPIRMMPSATESFGGQITSITTRHHQLAGSQSFPLCLDYPHKILSSGRIIQVPTEGPKFVGNQSYPSSHNNSMPSGFVTQNPTYENPVSATSTPSAPLYPHLSLENSRGNADYQEHCDICIRQRQLSAHEETSTRYSYQGQHLSEGIAPPSAELSQQGIPAYPEVPEFRGKTVSAVDQQINGSNDYIPLSECGIINFENASGPSNLANDMGGNVSDPRHKKYGIGAESNTDVPQSGVFSRLSPNQHPPYQEAMGPTLSQLVSSLSQKAKQWNEKSGPVIDGFCYMIREQATDRSYSRSELNLPSQLELEAEAGESTESQPPFLNFKRRSEAHKGDTNLGNEISGKVKRRKLVRPSFAENNACSGNCIQERKHDHPKVGGNHFDIDLNVPATVDSDPVEKHNRIEVCSSVLTKTQTEAADKTNSSNVLKTIKEAEKHNSIEVCPNVFTKAQNKTQTEDADKTNCSNVMEIKEHVPSFHNDAPAKKVSFDINLAELNMMDESKLRTIYDQASSLLQALGKIASVKSNNFEEDKSNIRGEL
ncbi:hypothetical protein EJB05_43993, partial [Eragrostis curvula]